MIRIILFLALSGYIEKTQGDVPGHVQYLIKYGYLEIPKESVSPVSFSEKDIDSALKTAQKFAGIPETGKFDNETIKMITAPRCGLPDTGSRVERYVQAGSKWDKRDITYGFLNYTAKLRRREIKSTLHSAFSKWAEPTGLIFSRVNSKKWDMKIGFFKGAHDDCPSEPFDGPGNVVAHAYYPMDGRVHFDDDEDWTTDVETPISKILLMNVATHELGHALGLRHSDVPGAIMAPHYKRQIDLGDDDVKGIKSLYGEADK